VVDSNTSQTSHTPAKVLVVDDDVDNGLLLKDFLQISGFDVDVYFSSEEASEKFESGRYSLAILDVLMDGIGGIELYKIISNIDTNTRVCFLTGYDINTSDYPDLLENKTKIVLKPVYLTQLLEIIRTLLNDNYSETT
jgi:two-component system, OmpR family, response regulator